ncbi:MAG TPA: hypothetical protein VIF15_14360 [Polyangiaceae bacterium]|jgi:hypothetical protein
MVRSWMVLGLAGLAALAGAVAACNGILGIGPASLESDDGGAALTCQYYCDTIMQNCPPDTANGEYLTADVCLKMCPAFEPNSTIADTADDTLGCRIFNAQQAASTPDVSCRFAGPLGGGHCGTNACADFCSLDVTYCDGTNGKPLVYPGGLADCQTACTGFPYLVVDAGDTTLQASNTLNCRLWHLETAYKSNDLGSFHCPHTGQISTTCK